MTQRQDTQDTERLPRLGSGAVCVSREHQRGSSTSRPLEGGSRAPTPKCSTSVRTPLPTGPCKRQPGGGGDGLAWGRGPHGTAASTASSLADHPVLSTRTRLPTPNTFLQRDQGLSTARDNTSRALLLRMVGPGQGLRRSWGGHLDSPGSGPRRGSASSQSASAGAVPGLSGQSQTPKCPASHQGQTAPHPTPHLPLGLHLPPPQPQSFGHQVGGKHLALG